MFRRSCMVRKGHVIWKLKCYFQIYICFLLYLKVNNSLSPETSDTRNNTRAKVISISFWCPQTVKKKLPTGKFKEVSVCSLLRNGLRFNCSVKNNDLFTVCEQHSWHSFFYMNWFRISIYWKHNKYLNKSNCSFNLL